MWAAVESAFFRGFSQSLAQVKGNYTGKDQGSKLMWYTSMWLHNGIMQFSGQKGLP